MSNRTTLKELNQNVIGSGPRTAGDLTPDQAEEAMNRILDRDPHPATFGAFLLANRWKGNTEEELIAFTDALIERAAEKRIAPDADPVDVGSNYDGKVKSPVLGVASGLIAASAGVPIVVHAGKPMPTKYGTTYRTVLKGLGGPTDITPSESARMVDEIGFGYYHQPAVHPPLNNLYPLRKKLGVRTLFNTIESFLNPAKANIHLGSFYHYSYAEKAINTLSGSEILDVERILMIQGMEGYDDVRPGFTEVVEWDGDELSSREIETARFGLDAETDELHVENPSETSVRLTEELITGNRINPFLDAVLLNSAILLYAGKEVDQIGEGVDRARTIIENGGAAERLRELQNWSAEKKARNNGEHLTV